MIESLFGKDNNIILIILVILILFSDELFGKGKGGFGGKGGFLDDNLIILGVLIFLLLQDNKGGKKYSLED